MHSIPVTLGQAAAKIPDPTPGQVAAGMLVLSVIAGSLIMISVWIARARQGTVVMPFAARKPLIVPVLLLAFGLLMSCAMAANVLMSGSIDPELMGQATDEAEATEGEQADTETATEDAAKPKADTEPQVAEAGDIETADNETADIESETDDELAADDEPAVAKPAALKKRLRLLMLGLINVNLFFLLIFGVTIWIFQKHVSRRQNSIDDVGYESHSTVPAATIPVATTTTPFPDLDAPPPSAQLAAIDAGNPYAAAADQLTAADADNPYADTTKQIAPSESPERWNFISEFRFACEAFLVAYLPTSIIRIAMVAGSPEVKSHPFLEMIENGVDTEIMALIFFSAVVMAPVVEELMFRVVVFGGMFQRNMFWPGMIISSVLFGLAHGFPDCIALLPLAAVIAFTYSRRRSYRTAILVHFLFNFFNMMLAGLSLM